MGSGSHGTWRTQEVVEEWLYTETHTHSGSVHIKCILTHRQTDRQTDTHTHTPLPAGGDDRAVEPSRALSVIRPVVLREARDVEHGQAIVDVALHREIVAVGIHVHQPRNHV